MQFQNCGFHLMVGGDFQRSHNVNLIQEQTMKKKKRWQYDKGLTQRLYAYPSPNKSYASGFINITINGGPALALPFNTLGPEEVSLSL